MNVQDAVKKIANKFVYKSDRKTIVDSWWLCRPGPDNTLIGDCEDFSLSVFWEISNQNWKKFSWNLLVSHRYQMHRTKDTNGEYHIVGSYDNLWFDNRTLEALPKEEFFQKTQHILTPWHRYWSPIILLFLISGWINLKLHN